MVIKIHSDAEELAAVNHLRQLPALCGHVLAQGFEHTDGRLFTIMPKYEGSIDQLLGVTHKDANLRSQILTAVTAQVMCLHKNNVQYLDIKPENILYNVTEKNCGGAKCYNVVLGDLGSEGVSTYPMRYILSPEENAKLQLCFLNLVMSQSPESAYEFSAEYLRKKLTNLVMSQSPESVYDFSAEYLRKKLTNIKQNIYVTDESRHRHFASKVEYEYDLAVLNMPVSLFTAMREAVSGLPSSLTQDMLLDFLDSKKDLLINDGLWSQLAVTSAAEHGLNFQRRFLEEQSTYRNRVDHALSAPSGY